jgi:hypothetical protein
LVLSVSIVALAIPIVFRVAFVVSTTALDISLIVPRSFRSLTVSFTSFAISRIAIVVSSIARAISSNAPVLTSVCINGFVVDEDSRISLAAFFVDSEARCDVSNHVSLQSYHQKTFWSGPLFLGTLYPLFDRYS